MTTKPRISDKERWLGQFCHQFESKLWAVVLIFLWFRKRLEGLSLRFIYEIYITPCPHHSGRPGNNVISHQFIILYARFMWPYVSLTWLLEHKVRELLRFWDLFRQLCGHTSVEYWRYGIEMGMTGKHKHKSYKTSYKSDHNLRRQEIQKLENNVHILRVNKCALS